MTTAPNDLSADTVDVANIARTVRRGWRVVVLTAAAGLVVGFAVLKLAPRRFTGTSSVVLGEDVQGSSSLLSQFQGVAGGLIAGSSPTPALETEIAILSSRAVADAVIDSLRLQATVASPRGVPSADLVSGLALAPAFRPRNYRFTRVGGASRPARYQFESGTDTGTAVAGQPTSLAVGTITLEPTTSLTAFTLGLADRQQAIDRLEADLTVSKPEGEVVEVEYSAADSLTAARVPNLLVATYMARRTTTDRGVNGQRVEFLSSRLDSLNRVLASREQALRHQEESSGVIDPVTVGKIELDQAGTLRSQLSDLEIEQSAAQRLISQVNAGTLTPRELAAFPTFLKSPGINGLLSQLTEVESKRDELLGARTAKDPQVQALSTAAKNLEGQLLPLTNTYVASLATQRGTVEQQFDSLQAVVATLPATAQAAGRLQRDVLDLSKLSAALQSQLVDAQLAAIGEGGNVHLLDAAVAPDRPTFPRPATTLAGGLGGGIVLGILAALTLGFFGRWVHDPVDVERAAGVPALRFDAQTPLLMAGRPLSSTVLLLPLGSASTAGVAERLARTAMARSGTPTVLDLSMSDSAGGPQLPDAAATLTRLEQEYETVIVRLPGLTSHATAAVLSPTRTVLLVAPAGPVERAPLMNAVTTLRRLAVPCAGVVMNRETDAVAIG